MKLAVLNRLKTGAKQTLGHLSLYEGPKLLGEFYILELPDRDNQTDISRIPEGFYRCIPRQSQKYKEHYHVLDVLDRTLILIHYGNYYTNTKGCLLLGDELVDINRDGLMDVTNSVASMKRFNELTERQPINLIINDYVDLQ